MLTLLLVIRKGRKENQFVATRFFGLGENDACRIGAVGHQSRVAITLRRRQNGKKAMPEKLL